MQFFSNSSNVSRFGDGRGRSSHTSVTVDREERPLKAGVDFPAATASGRGGGGGGVVASAQLGHGCRSAAAIFVQVVVAPCSGVVARAQGLSQEDALVSV